VNVGDERQAERLRYDHAAQLELAQARNGVLPVGVDDSPPQFWPPYIRYHEHISDTVKPDSTVLEIGAGGGRHTAALVQASRQVVAFDISVMSLSVCRVRTEGGARLVAGDMANLPFAGRSFDVITSAGSLSYGDPHQVNEELRRVLKPGGSLIVVDSLNHNPVYRLNRWVNYRRGKRTRSTILRMPTAARIRDLAKGFESVTTDYFGTYSFLFPAMARGVGPDRALELCEALGAKASGSGRYAFKFVLLAQGFRPDRCSSSGGGRAETTWS
jgi:ubiquinone/menaquinone biosynthesis C-methylase UbiE